MWGQRIAVEPFRRGEYGGRAKLGMERGGRLAMKEGRKEGLWFTLNLGCLSPLSIVQGDEDGDG